MDEKNIEIDKDFSDIDEKNKYKDYIIVGVLYILVIILSILFIIGIKNQKDVIKNNIKNDNDIQEDSSSTNNTKENETFDKDNSSNFKDEPNLDYNKSLNENNEQTNVSDSILNENKKEINSQNFEEYDESNVLDLMQ